MKRTIEGMAGAGEALLQEVNAALRQYHEARAAGEPPAQAERLRLLAESAYQAAADYQLHTLGHPSLTKHGEFGAHFGCERLSKAAVKS